MPATENNYQLDGADNKEGFFNTFNVAPSVDAVQEFKIQIGQYSAEFGSGGGAVINVVTKSGTNGFHGTLWEFIRNDKLDARNFFLSPTTKKACPAAQSVWRRREAVPSRKIARSSSATTMALANGAGFSAAHGFLLPLRSRAISQAWAR